MLDPTDTERWAETVLAHSRGDLSSVARRGFLEHGRGAVFVWPPEGRPTEYKAAYLPAQADALRQAGNHPKDKTDRYDPERQFVAVFVGPNEDVCTLLVELDSEPAPSKEDA